MNNVKVSIVVPVYNVEQYILECLTSIASQTYSGAIECIVVDDCGQDRSIAIAQQFVDTYQGPIQFTIVTNPKSDDFGPSSARNLGIELATGDYIYFLDSDDMLKPHCIESLVAPLQEEWYDIVAADFEVVGGDASRYDEMHLTHCPPIVRNGEIVAAYNMVGKINVLVWNRLYNRQFLLNHKLFFKEGLIHEDNLWTFEVCYEAQSLRAVKQATYVHRLNPTSIMAHDTAQRRILYFPLIVEGMLARLDFARRDTIAVAYSVVMDYAIHIVKRTAETANWSLARDVYGKLHTIARPHLASFKRGVGSLKRGIYDLHFYMPESLGFYILKLLILAYQLKKRVLNS